MKVEPNNRIAKIVIFYRMNIMQITYWIRKKGFVIMSSMYQKYEGTSTWWTLSPNYFWDYINFPVSKPLLICSGVKYEHRSSWYFKANG